jgi:hypothetical protein
VLLAPPDPPDDFKVPTPKAEFPPEPLEPPYAKTPVVGEDGAAFVAVLNQALFCEPYVAADGTFK